MITVVYRYNRCYSTIGTKGVDKQIWWYETACHNSQLSGTKKEDPKLVGSGYRDIKLHTDGQTDAIKENFDIFCFVNRVAFLLGFELFYTIWATTFSSQKLSILRNYKTSYTLWNLKDSNIWSIDKEVNILYINYLWVYRIIATKYLLWKLAIK